MAANVYFDDAAEEKAPEIQIQGRLRGQRWMLTYQNIHLSKASPETFFPDAGADKKGLHIFHEHAPTTGRPHTHVAVWFLKSLGPAQPLTLKLKFKQQGVYPNDMKVITTNDHWNNVVEYAKKEDPEPLAWGQGKVGGKSDKVIEAMTQLDKCQHHSWRQVVICKECAPLIVPRYKWAREYFTASKPQVEPPEIDLQPWQHEVIQILKDGPIHRQILWIWSEASQVGKTTLLNYLRKEFSVLPVAGGLKDIWYAVANERPDILHLNLAREAKIEDWAVILEHLSDHGVKLSTKYETQSIHWAGHLVVTSNLPPNMLDLLLPGRVVAVEAQALPGVDAVLPGQHFAP